MKLQAGVIVCCAWAVTSAGLVFGQQAFGNEFDLSVPIHLEGKITKLEWVNPHVHADIAVPDNNGGTATWRAALSSISNLSRAGMTKNTIRVGDDVVVEGFAAKAGTLRVGTAPLTVKNSGINVAVLPEAWHHSFAEQYDAKKPAQLTGRFVSIDWVLHPLVHFTVSMQDGSTQEWLSELPLLPTLNRQGWNQTTLNPGDELQADGASAWDGSQRPLANSVTLLAIGGNRLSVPRVLLNGTLSK